MEATKTYINNLIYRVINAAIEVHKCLGPGFLESIYHRCMEKELSLRQIHFKSELVVPVDYKGLELEAPIRCDLFVEEIPPVELKAAREILPVNESQLLTYMKLLHAPKGLIINFNTTHIYKEGQRTFVNEWYRDLPE